MVLSWWNGPKVLSWKVSNARHVQRILKLEGRREMSIFHLSSLDNKWTFIYPNHDNKAGISQIYSSDALFFLMRKRILSTILQAMEEWNGKEIEGVAVDCSLAKPQSDKKKKPQPQPNRGGMRGGRVRTNCQSFRKIKHRHDVFSLAAIKKLKINSSRLKRSNVSL